MWESHIDLGVAAMVAAFSIEKGVALGLTTAGGVGIGASILVAVGTGIVGYILGSKIIDMLTEEQKESLSNNVGWTLGVIIVGAVLAGALLVPVIGTVGAISIAVGIAAGLVASVLEATLTDKQIDGL